MHHVQSQIVPIGGHDLFGLVLAQQAVVHEHAGELVRAQGAARQGAGHGGVHAAGEARDDLAGADLRLDLGDHAADHVLGAIAAHAAADAEDEVAQHLHALHRVPDLRVELHAIDAQRRVGEGGHRAVVGVGVHGEALRRHGHPIPMVHEHGGLAAAALEQGRVLGGEQGVAVLPHLRGGHLAAKHVVDQLHAVADAQHRHAQPEHLHAQPRGVFAVDAVGPAGQDHALERVVPPGVDGRGVVQDLAVDPRLAHAAGDQLVVLAAEVQYDDLLGNRHPQAPFFGMIPRCRWVFRFGCVNFTEGVL